MTVGQTKITVKVIRYNTESNSPGVTSTPVTLEESSALFDTVVVSGSEDGAEYYTFDLESISEFITNMYEKLKVPYI